MHGFCKQNGNNERKMRMTGMMSAMKKKKFGIPEDVLSIFEGIVRKNVDESGSPHLVGITRFEPEWDDEFSQAMLDHLTQEQRFRLYELERALGIKLKIKSVDVSPLRDDVKNPVVFTFEIVD